MISYASPLAVGDCCQIVLMPPEGVTKWRVLRKSTGAPVSYNDPDAILVYEGNANTNPLDFDVRNGETWHYTVFYLSGLLWIEGAHGAQTVTVNSRYTYTPDLIPLIQI